MPLLIWGITLCIVGGGVMRFGLPLSNNAVARARRLQPATVALLRHAPVGAEVLVEGRIAGGNPPLAGSLVSYEQERYRKTYRSWERYRRQTPPLLLQLSDGIARVANEDYRLLDPPAISENDIDRFQGFRPWDTVMVIAHVTGSGDTASLRADFLYGGTRSDYITEQRRNHLLNLWLGPALLCLGGVLILWGGIVIFRRRALSSRAITELT
jgi:hypothetical protein